MNRIKNDINNKEQNKKTHSLTFKKIKIILIIIFTLIILLAIYTGISVSRWQNLAQDMIANSPSQVLDADGKVITEIGNNKNIKNVSLTDIPNNLKNAYISIEDQRFYKHPGVDFPRTTAAIFSYIKNLGSSSFGGSSITQQLVKNLTGDNSSKVTRKINEWIKALAIEGVLEKDEILESYLNIIYVGPNIYGVGLGSEYYFNKNINELNLAECAFLAGINNSPNSYNPFGEKDNTEKINKRTKTVLSKMYELKYISETEYNEAIATVDKGLKFKNGKIESSNNNSIYSYHTDALIAEIIEDISKTKHISTDFATNYINMAGLKIYSTQNTNIQNEIETELSKNKYILKSKNDPSVTSQAAMVIIDHSTGYVVGCVGGLGKKETSRGFNRATQALRQIGSASKPLTVLVPAIDKKLITPASIYVDEATTFNDGTDEGYSPTDYNDYKGSITIRQAIESSQNIPFVKVMEELTPKISIEYMKKMGITTLTKIDENLNLALGGLDKGISPLEMAASYACIANDGVYIEPTFYTKIENNIGKTVVKSKQRKKNVFSKQVAFLLKSLLSQPVIGSSGTANYCKISGIDVAAKTGTTNEDYDRWLCGFTPYYSAATWFGFDLNETINFNRKNPSGEIWANVMKKIHSNLDNRTFEIPNSGLEAVKICPKSGLLSNSGCSNSYTEYFLNGTIPTLYCTDHTGTYTTTKSTTTNTTDTKTTTKTQEQTQEPNADLPVQEIPTQTNNNNNNSSNSSKPSHNNLNTSVQPSNTTTNETSTIPENTTNSSISNTTDTDDDFNFDTDDNTFEQ